MKRSISSLLTVLSLLLFLVPGSASASSSYEMSRTELSWVSDVVVQGEVISSQARWKADRSAIYTWTEIRVTESLKGDHQPGETLMVRALGGRDGGASARVIGEARFSEGEEVIVFLEHTRDGHLRTVGMSQGRFTLVADADGGPTVVIRPFLHEDEAYDHRRLAIPNWERPETAEEFLRAVRSDIVQERLPVAAEIPGLSPAKQARLTEAHAVIREVR